MANYDTIIDSVIDTVYILNSNNNNVDIIKDIVEISNSSISCQISTLNAFIAGFSLLFVIAGVILGIYISNLEKKTLIIKENVEKKEWEIIKLAETVKETDEKIQSDISGLYAKLRDEESITLLKRLEEEPQDVSNLSKTLLARQLKPEWFAYLKTAFYKLLELGDEADKRGWFSLSYKDNYLLLMFQHYMYFSIKDDIIREQIKPRFGLLIKCAFKRDIVKTTTDLCKALSEQNITFDKSDILVSYLSALNDSSFNNLPELKKIFEDKILDKSLLADAIEKCTNNKTYLKLFDINPPVEE